MFFYVGQQLILPGPFDTPHHVCVVAVKESVVILKGWDDRYFAMTNSDLEKLCQR